MKILQFGLFSFLFFSFWLPFFVFFIVPSPICFSFWSASLFHNLIYIYCTETLWLTSLNLYRGAWIEDIWNITLASDLHLWYPQLLAGALIQSLSFPYCSIVFHCVLVHIFYQLFYHSSRQSMIQGLVLVLLSNLQLHKQ